VIDVLIAGRSRLSREALAQALRGTTQISIVASTPTVLAALKAGREAPQTVVLMDVPRGEGAFAIRTARRTHPNFRFVAYDIPAHTDDVVFWANTGAFGCIIEEAPMSEYLEAVATVHRGGVFCSPGLTVPLFQRTRIAADPCNPMNLLSSREREIMALVDEGLANREIAERLHLQVPTVKNHLRRIFTKLGVQHRQEAAEMLRQEYLSISSLVEAD
jgi:two-component system nitrate/nitrite response regulator NarL